MESPLAVLQSRRYNRYKPYGLDRVRKEKVAIENPKLSAQLERSAERHFDGDKEDGWKTYYAMRSAEKCMLEKEFSDCIFLTYNNPDYREILPDLPTLYIYANNGSEPPWLPDKNQCH